MSSLLLVEVFENFGHPAENVKLEVEVKPRAELTMIPLVRPADQDDAK